MTAAKPARLLFIAPIMPDCGGNGLAMRQGQFLSAYARHFAVDLAVIPLAGAGPADARFATRHAQRLRLFEADAFDTHFSLIMQLRDPAARLAAFQTYGRPSLAARLTTGLRGAFATWIENRRYDLVHIGRLYLLGLHRHVAAPGVIDADEDDARVYNEIAQTQIAQTQIARTANCRAETEVAAWARAEAGHAKREAAELLPRMRHVFTASAADAASLKPFNRAITVIPNTVARPRAKPPMNSPNVLFIGTLGYRPNDDGIIWFIKKCWPGIRKQVPLARLDIVGAGASLALRRLAFAPGITLWGRQKDLARFYAQAGAVIVPVHAGGGSRIKFLEAAAFGAAIVATRSGAEGAELKPIRDFLLAADPNRFAAAVTRLLANSRRLRRAARLAVERGHDPARASRHIIAIVRAIANQPAI